MNQKAEIGFYLSEQIEIFFGKFFGELNDNLSNSKLADDLDYKELEEFSQFL